MNKATEERIKELEDKFSYCILRPVFRIPKNSYFYIEVDLSKSSFINKLVDKKLKKLYKLLNIPNADISDDHLVELVVYDVHENIEKSIFISRARTVEVFLIEEF